MKTIPYFRQYLKMQFFINSQKWEIHCKLQKCADYILNTHTAYCTVHILYTVLHYYSNFPCMYNTVVLLYLDKKFYQVC